MRIIAGSAKGHTIKAPKGMSTRPTLDRVRESIFNVLNNHGLYGKTILDIFSGTGAMALEALSRGAISAISIDKRTGKLIKENAIHCHLEDKLQILSVTIQQSGKILSGQKFDYIFSDPPYEKGLIDITIKLVNEYDLLNDNGILVIEHHEKEAIVLPDGWTLIKSQKFGYTCVAYLQKATSGRS